MAEPFVPADFDVPVTFDGPGFRLEPLGAVHNERDHQAWMSSIDHIRTTPGMEDWDWPAPMTLEENLADMEMHARHFAERAGFTYSVLDHDDVIGCVYIYPAKDGNGAQVRSWVRESRAEMDATVWKALSNWLDEEWPFRLVSYAPRSTT